LGGTASSQSEIILAERRLKNMKPKIEAKITLLLREQDVRFLLEAVKQFKAENEKEASNRKYMLEVLELLVLN
jgi:hypothetical protein